MEKEGRASIELVLIEPVEQPLRLQKSEWPAVEEMVLSCREASVSCVFWGWQDCEGEKMREVWGGR